MALCTYLTLKADGSDVEGESKKTSHEREGTIECFSFEYGVASGGSTQSGSGASGDIEYEPIRIVKAIDRSTPLLWHAMIENHDVEAVFKFFRPKEVGKGDEHYYTTTIARGRVTSIDFQSPYAGMGDEPTETVTFSYNEIRQEYIPGSTEAEDSFAERE